MQTLEQTDKGAANLYWLAYLLTGQRGASVDVTLAALDSDGGPDSFFSTWMFSWSRRVAMAKALAAISGELAASARRTALERSEKAAPLPRNWALNDHTSRIQLERAVLAIDALPRCALVLSVFEGVSLEDTAILLDIDRELARKARNIGLRELTRNLAGMQGWKSTGTTPCVFTGEVQHA
jgi:DNA-directed RNA polymerase specialized sigma24 family protein